MSTPRFPGLGYMAEAPRHPAKRAAFMQVTLHKRRKMHPPMSVRIENYQPKNYSDLGGQGVAPGDIWAITLAGHGWLHIHLAQGPRLELPIRALLHRDTFRSVCWEQAKAVMLIPGGQGCWLAWVAARLAAFGIVVRPLPRPPRFHESEPDD
jgi:hypothetical protein